MIYSRMLDEYNRLEKEINTLNNQINALPSGNLLFSHNGKYLKWYQSDGHNQVYIPKSNRQLAEQLAYKKYLTLQRDEFIKERDAIQLYLNYHSSNNNSADKLLSKDSDYHSFLQPNYKSLNAELNDWMNSPYEHNEMYPEQRNQSTISGHLVRSKSEALIDTFLYKNKIPFRYEAALSLGDITFYPDFTIRHPLTGRLYYWEHFGMMDSPDYARKAYSKLQRYSSYDIIQDINLITTYETKDTPLNPEWIENLIKYHFL